MSQIHISVLTWNINGLSDLKFIDHHQQLLFSQHDIILLQETICKHVDPSFFKGFQLFHFNQNSFNLKRGHGLVIAVRENSVFSAQRWEHTSSSLWVCLRFKNGIHDPLFVGNVYLPPTGSPQLKNISLETRVGEIQGLLQTLNEGAHIFIGGDFNAHIDLVSTSHGENVEIFAGQNAGGRQLVNFAHQLGLHICTGRVQGDIPALVTYRATARSVGTRPDHILVSHSLLQFLNSTQVGAELKGSDHFPLVAKLSLTIPTLHTSPPMGDIVRGITWRNKSRIAFIEGLEQAGDSLRACATRAQDGNLAEALESFVNVLLACAEHAGMPRCEKIARTPSCNRPFFDGECQRLKREWRRAGRLHGYQSPTVKAVERHYHSLVRSRKRAWLMSQLQDCIRLFHACPRQFWQSFRGATPGLPGPLLSLDAWQDFLQCMVRPDPLALRLTPCHLSPVAYPWAVCEGTHLNEPFTLAEVEEGLASLHTGKSNGFLGFPSELLRFAQRPFEREGTFHPHLLAPTLLVLLNALFTEGSIPQGFNVSKVSPVVKDTKKNVLDTSNYRPIAVPEPLMRLYATLLNNRLVQYLESTGYRCEAQVGFRPQFSTLHQLFTLQHFIDRSTIEDPLYCIKMDLSKAYDMVPRHLLWEAVRRAGIQGTFLEALKSVYEDGELVLMVGGTFGTRDKARSGITQGSPLSPTLFGIYFDGYIRYVEAKCTGIGPRLRGGRHVPVLAYADDGKALSKNREEGNLILKATEEWCDMARMIISPNKTHVIAFPEGAEAKLDGHFTYKGYPLEVVTQSRHLGVVFSSAKGMGETFAHLHGKMWAAWYSILHKYGNLRSATSISILLKVFLACVVPTASYACELWGWHKVPKSSSGITSATLEKAFLKMLRAIVGVRTTVKTDIFLTELGVRPLKYQWLKRMVTFWNALVNLPENHLYAQVLRDSCYFGVTSRVPTWAGSFMVAIRSIGYPYTIDCHQPKSIDMDAFRELLARSHRLTEHVHISPRLTPRDPLTCTYIRWFGQPTALQRTRLQSLPLDVRRVRTFYRFRLGVHDLPIDVGRRQNIPRNERLCDMCGSEVGDERHFIFHCPTFSPLRQEFAWLFSSGSSSVRRFIWQDDLVGVVNFVYEGFRTRDQVLRSRGSGSV